MSQAKIVSATQLPAAVATAESLCCLKRETIPFGNLVVWCCLPAFIFCTATRVIRMLTTLAPWLPKKWAPHSQATFGVVGVHQPLGIVEKPLVAQALGLLAEAVQQFPQGTRAAGSSTWNVGRWGTSLLDVFEVKPPCLNYVWVHFRLDSFQASFFQASFTSSPNPIGYNSMGLARAGYDSGCRLNTLLSPSSSSSSSSPASSPSSSSSSSTSTGW